MNCNAGLLAFESTASNGWDVTSNGLDAASNGWDTGALFSYSLFSLINYMGRDRERMIGIEGEPSCFAAHQVRDGWEIFAPSDDPTTPAYWRVDVIRQHDWTSRTSPMLRHPHLVVK